MVQSAELGWRDAIKSIVPVTVFADATWLEELAVSGYSLCSPYALPPVPAAMIQRLTEWDGQADRLSAIAGRLN